MSQQTIKSQEQLLLEQKLPQWRKSPLAFIEDMWNITPQPLKPEFKTAANILIENNEFDKFQSEWFEPFIKGLHLTWQQWAIFLGLEAAIANKASKRITTSSGHGIGKSCMTSLTVIWRLFCFHNSQIACTAPTSRQLFDVLWKEISIWIKRMPEGWQGKFDCQSTYIRMTEAPTSWFASAKTAKKDNTTSLAGVHGEHVMVLADEASGVMSEVFNTMEGSLTEKDILVMLFSNPTNLNGYFYDSHNHPKLKKRWQRFQFSNIDSPIVREDYNQDIIDQHGENSDEYKIRVLGQFPKEDATDDDGYAPLIHKEDIKEIDFPLQKKIRDNWIGTTIMGIDPAGGGTDETVWIVRDQFKAVIALKEKTSDKFTIANRTRTLADIHKVRPENIWLDGFGVGNDSSVELAKENFHINSLNVGDACKKDKNKALYLNRRAEAFWTLRKVLKSGFELYRDPIWRDEATFIPYRRNARGKIQIMPKKDLRKKYRRSPDTFDALMLTFLNPYSGMEVKTFTNRQRKTAEEQSNNNPTSIKRTSNNLNSVI